MSRKAVEWCKRQVHIRGATRAVLWVLCDHANSDDHAYPSQLTMAAESGYSARTVGKVLRALSSGDDPRIVFVRKRPDNVSEWRLLIPGGSEPASELTASGSELGSEPEAGRFGTTGLPVRNYATSGSELASDKPQEPQEEPQPAARARGNGPPPSTEPPRTRTPHADTSPDSPAPHPESKEWLAILTPEHIGLNPRWNEWRVVRETLPTHGSAREIQKRYRALRTQLGRMPRGSEVVGLAQDIRAEWEEASRPDPQAAILADQDALHRRLGIGRYRDTNNAGEQSPEGDSR